MKTYLLFFTCFILLSPHSLLADDRCVANVKTSDYRSGKEQTKQIPEKEGSGIQLDPLRYCSVAIENRQPLPNQECTKRIQIVCKLQTDKSPPNDFVIVGNNGVCSATKNGPMLVLPAQMMIYDSSFAPLWGIKAYCPES
jgi:hypothetical protein